MNTYPAEYLTNHDIFLGLMRIYSRVYDQQRDFEFLFSDCFTFKGVNYFSPELTTNTFGRVLMIPVVLLTYLLLY